MAIKLSAIAALGAPPVAVLIFEVALNATSMFNHGNISLPQRIDRILRLIVVTPDMHRVHHSVIIRETNSNYGFNLPWWDRLFGTYKSQPAKGHTDMVNRPCAIPGSVEVVPAAPFDFAVRGRSGPGADQPALMKGVPEMLT
jgi:sterol desaturase/sphingolipid hydroxylase (fatty acid hydroxylase superfamily)